VMSAVLPLRSNRRGLGVGAMAKLYETYDVWCYGRTRVA
jgi:hypothetical protein